MVLTVLAQRHGENGDVFCFFVYSHIIPYPASFVNTFLKFFQIFLKYAKKVFRRLDFGRAR